MKKLLLFLVAVVVLGFGWWAVRPLLFEDVVDEDFPPILIEHDLTQKEIDAMPEAEKMEMERKIVEEMEAMPDKVMEEELPEPVEVIEEEAPEPPAVPVAIKTGNFVGADSFHRGSGQATIYQQPDGSYFLRLENFEVTNGPDLRVYLTDAQSPSKSQVAAGTSLGKLKGNIGSQNYILPSGVSPENVGSVVIYCQPFKVIFASANIQ